jgi:outer membrane protein assembly factor BamB
MTQDYLPEQRLQKAGRAWYRAALGTALVAGLFCCVVLGRLGWETVRRMRQDPLTNARMAQLRAEFAKAPSDELRETIREHDLTLRRAQERYVAVAGRGAWLLLGGAIVLIVAARVAAAFHHRLPRPQHEHVTGREEEHAAAWSRWAVAAAAAVLLGAGLTGGLLTPAPASLTEKKELDPAKQWPRFRGPGGLGISAFTNVPSAWDGATGKNIRWKTAVPLPGQNSPIVWGDRVFLSGATKTRRAVFCFDADTGELLWTGPVEDVPGSPDEAPKVFEQTGYAAPTMATDGRRVYAVFANGDLAAFTFQGRRLWAQSLGTPNNIYGHAASLTTHDGNVLIQLDQGGMPEDELSSVLAIDGATGDLVWETFERPVPNSWSSPIVIRVGEARQLITCGAPWIIAYDPAGGGELWRVNAFSADVGPSPIYARGLVIACNEGNDLLAIRPDGLGDVTDTHVVYRTGEALPNTCSPLSDGQLTFLASGTLVSCYDTATGKLVWDHDEFREMFVSSPSLVGDRVYLMDEKGVMHIFPAARTFREVGTARLGEKASTCPAFADGRIYIRGETHLFCIEERRGDD